MSKRNIALPSVDRRQFLKAGSIAAVGFAVPTSLLRAASAPLLPVLSVGFAENFPISTTAAGVRLQPAKDLLFGDPRFVSVGARLRIGTFQRSSRFADAPGGVDLEIVFPSYGFLPENYPEFQAWRYQHIDGVRSTSQSVSLNVPVTATDGLRMVFREPSKIRSRAARGGTPATVEAAPSVLAFDTGVTSNAMKLQRGAYVIAFREAENEREPNWDDQVLYRGDHTLLLNSSATFTYLILTVDYAA